MIYLLASFIDRNNNDAIVGFRCVNVKKDNIGHYFDLEIKNLVDLVESGKLEVFNVKNKFDLEDWAKYVTVFDVNTYECLNEMKYVKLSDTEYIDCLGKRYTVRNLAELDNFASSHIFTNLDDKEEMKVKAKPKSKSKKDRTDDEVIFKDICGLNYYAKIRDLTDKYVEFLDYSDDVEIELLDMPKAGRFSYKLSDKKEGKLKVCKDRRTGLYGVCCNFDKYVWVILEPKYKQLETVQSGSTTYVAAFTEQEYWEFIDLKKDIKSERALEWCSISNMPGKNGKLFVALSGGLKAGYKWYVMGKGLKVDRQIGCSMLLTDALFTSIRGYTKLASTIEFYDPRHGESILINLKDYSMEGMMNFKKSFTTKEEGSNKEKEVVLYYNIVCDSTVGEINFMTDKNYLEGTITLTDIDNEFINNLSVFLNATPKCETLDVKVKRHVAKRTHYTYQKIDVDLALKVKKFLSTFAAFTSAKILGLYWSFREIDSLDKAIADIELDKYKVLTVCDDGKELYIRAGLFTHLDNSIDLILFTRRCGRLIRVEYMNLVDSSGSYKDELETSLGMQKLETLELERSKYYDLEVQDVIELSTDKDVAEKPTIDIVQTYKKSKLTLKCTTYRKMTKCKIIVKVMGFEDELGVYLTSFDGLDFKTSEYGIEDLKLKVEDRNDIEKVREYVKVYNKVLNENQPLIGGYHAAAFNIRVD